jgi:phosphoribosylanthranilate isomerase
MGRTLIKICGVTRVEDAVAAARLGADFVGMVLHADSPRTITVEQARAIVDALPNSVTPVALFVDAPPVQVLQTCAALNVTHAQLHGHERLDLLGKYRPLVIWKAMRVHADFAFRVKIWPMLFAFTGKLTADAIVLDTPSGKAAGGTGLSNNWSRVEAGLREQKREMLPAIVAAGGLTPTNVGDVVRAIRPWAVDVSSGVEGSKKGIKSEAKIDSFIRAVRAADESGAHFPSPGTPGEG